jgi:hypothetical protein
MAVTIYGLPHLKNMEKVVNWTKGIFDSSYQIFCNGQICGNLMFETWNNNALGIMSQKNYHFKCNGWFNTTTTIYDDTHAVLGTIQFNFWQLRAVASLKDATPLSWNYTNSWLSKWTISNYQNTNLQYKANSGTGTVIGQNIDHELALIVGLYIKEFFARILVAFIMFVAIMVIVRGV